MKIRYSRWTKDKSISPNSLRFDPENPRLRDVEQNEKAIIAALAESEDVSDLLRKIIKNGYAPIERLVVVYDESKPIVIEGNRRLAVCKMLLNPEKAPGKLATLVKAARNELGDSELPKRVRCDIPKDHAEARIYAYMKHAEDKFFRPWAKIQQAVIECRMADAIQRGELPEVELTEGQIKEARAMVEFYRLTGMLAQDPASEIKADALRDFPYEAVKRVFLAKETGEALGLKVDKSGILVQGNPNDFTEFFRKTLVKMGEGRATREFNTQEQAKEWISKVGYKPTDTKMSRLSDQIENRSDNDEKPDDNQPISGKPTKARAFADRRKSKVFPESLKLEYSAPRLAAVIREVEKIDVGTHANTSGIMLRCVLELALDGALAQRDFKPAYTSWLKGGSDTLKMRVQWLYETKPIDMDRDVERLVRGLLNAKNAVATLESLNGWVHSNWCPASGDDVRIRATSLMPLLRLLLAKP